MLLSLLLACATCGTVVALVAALRGVHSEEDTLWERAVAYVLTPPRPAQPHVVRGWQLGAVFDLLPIALASNSRVTCTTAMPPHAGQCKVAKCSEVANLRGSSMHPWRRKHCLTDSRHW
jgi:hypothetical protein